MMAAIFQSGMAARFYLREWRREDGDKKQKDKQ